MGVSFAERIAQNIESALELMHLPALNGTMNQNASGFGRQIAGSESRFVFTMPAEFPYSLPDEI